ncbi:hypothetical protein V502_02141 [Pseudogymnoascus sp. VKM F-4520 (FW-2644)]|nr:hypothetical protein V502_02141 [Pseudogymnoascus sp. VKM F-4520 (FW-2644)]
MPKTSSNNAALDAVIAASDPPRVAFACLPDIFVANIGNNCTTANSSNVQFPDHGFDLISYNDDTKDPIGSCAPMARSVVCKY